MVGSKDYVHAQMGRKGNEQPRIFRQIIRKTSRILDNFYFLQPWFPYPLHIGQPCSYSFLDSRSSLIVRQLKLSQLPLIIGKEGGREGDHNWKIISFTFYMFQSI